MAHPRASFEVIAFDQGGRMKTQGESNTVRLVCITPSGDKVVVWGTDGVNTKSIELVEAAGLPCEIECEYRDPDPPFRQQYGHTHWVRQDMELKVL